MLSALKRLMLTCYSNKNKKREVYKMALTKEQLIEQGLSEEIADNILN